MPNLEQQLAETKQLALDFLNFSKSIHGRSTEYYNGKTIKVRCYFADNSDHTSVSFDNSFDGGIEISFFDNVSYELSDSTFPRLEKILREGKAMLDNLISTFENEDEREARERKIGRKKMLIAELKEIEEGRE